MKQVVNGLLLVGAAVGLATVVTWADGDRSFQRVGTLANYRQFAVNTTDETVSEIVASTQDGMTLVYTDAARGTVGFIDITDPRQPTAARRRRHRSRSDRRRRVQPDLGRCLG